MTARLTKHAYEQLIAENISWLKQQPSTLERQHIEKVLQASVDHEYPSSSSPLTELLCGEKYNWIGQQERLVYIGKNGNWHQFTLINDPARIWCEVLDESLNMMEKTTT